MKHETQLYVDRVEILDQLPAEQRREVQNSPRLQSVLEENRALRQLTAGATEPPTRSRVLGHVYSQAGSTQENKTMSFKRLFTGRPLGLQLAAGTALLLVIVCLSIVLPRVMFSSRGIEVRGMQPAYAATEGYLLLYDFGEADMATVQPLIDKLTAAVRAFKKAHRLPDDQSKHEFKLSVASEQREVTTGAAPAAAAAPGPEGNMVKSSKVLMVIDLQDDTLLDELQAELARIPGLPEPQVTDATWFSEKGLPLPDDKDGVSIQLNLGNSEHTFTFPKSATTEEMQQAITEWLAQDNPGRQFKVKVDKTAEGDKTRIEIRIEGEQESGGAGMHKLRLQAVPEGDTIKLALNFGDVAHEFIFSKSASEEQIAAEINAWLAANQPGHKVQASVKKTVVNGETQLEVKIEAAEVSDTDTPE